MRRKSGDELAIRPMRDEEVAIAVDWAAAEGWNPGLADARCFAAAGAGGFLVGETEGRPAAVISIVNHDERLAFLGFYIVRPELRGRGFGRRLWQEALARARPRTIGLDGVAAQQANYAKSGFSLAHGNIRYGGTPQTYAAVERTVPLGDVPLEAVVAEDARVFPASRPQFWRAWLGTEGHVGRALIRDGSLAAWGVIRPCRNGRKIGPLVAVDATAAETVLADLAGEGGGTVYLDVPQPNAEGVALAEALGLAPLFETARMYNGPVRPVALARVFGVTCFELG